MNSVCNQFLGRIKVTLCGQSSSQVPTNLMDEGKNFASYPSSSQVICHTHEKKVVPSHPLQGLLREWIKTFEI